MAFLVIAATVVRSFGVSVHPMYDEAASWTFARLPWPSFWKVMWNFEGNMIFYYLLLREWVHLGDSEAALRSLSVLFGVATVPAVYDLGRRLFNRRTGLIAAAILTVHALHVLWSQQARGYTLMTLLLVVSTSLLVCALRAPDSRRTWAAYVIVSALACYCQVLAVLVLISQWLWVAATAGRSGLRRAVGPLLWLAILITPVGLYALGNDSGQEEWVEPLTSGRFMHVLLALAGEPQFAPQVGTSLLWLLCFAGFYFGSRSRNQVRAAAILMACWLLFPIAVIAAVSLFKPLFVERYLLMCVPALLLLAGFALDRLLASSREWMIWVGGITACLVFGLGAWSSFAQYRAAVGRPDAFRAMTDYILSRQRPGDAAMFFTAAAHMSFNYYASFAAPDRRQYLPKIVLPDFGDAPSGAQPIPSAQEVRNASEGYRTVWLVLNMTSVGHTPARRAAAPMIVSTLEEKFELSERVRIGNFWVVRFVRKSG